MNAYIDIVFDGPPSHESGRFVEVENQDGLSINFGEWVQRHDGLWALRIVDSGSQLAASENERAAGEWKISAIKDLLALQEEAEGSPDWRHGETLIRETYFKEYAQELAEDIGAIDRNASWPNNCIDWDEATDLLKQDYFSVDFDGVDYLIRS